MDNNQSIKAPLSRITTFSRYYAQNSHLVLQADESEDEKWDEWEGGSHHPDKEPFSYHDIVNASELIYNRNYRDEESTKSYKSTTVPTDVERMISLPGPQRDRRSYTSDSQSSVTTTSSENNDYSQQQVALTPAMWLASRTPSPLQSNNSLVAEPITMTFVSETHHRDTTPQPSQQENKERNQRG